LLSLLTLCFVFLPVSRATQQSDAPRAAMFPALTTYSLDKAKINLPADFEGKVNLLLISFEPEQSKDIETWMPTAQAVQHMNFLFRYYKMPVSNQENFIYRWWDSSSLRSVETDPEAWHWIIPLYTNKDNLCRALNIPTEKEVVLLLVDKTGQVLWRTSGRMTTEKKTSLANAVSAATHLP
jgi:ornithine cyclodeaminase/alanine dehydrogenase-like protein (mu-crystallin family)